MDEAGAERLMDQETLEGWVDSGYAPDWVEDHWRTFNGALLGEGEAPFPYFFGVESVRDGEPLYTAVPSTTDKDTLLDLGRVLLEYLETGPDQGDRASLVAFFRPPDRKLSLRSENSPEGSTGPQRAR